MQLMATLDKHVEGLKNLDSFTINHVMGDFATCTFTEKTRQEWDIYVADLKVVPEYNYIKKFFNHWMSIIS